MNDPYPGKTFEQALKVLKERFPDGNIEHHPHPGDVLVSVTLADGGSFRAGLTWQQAKYLAFSQLTGDDLRDQRFPEDWPS
jgi:hypothetical protein